MVPLDFIALIAPPAQESARLTRIPAGFTVAQAALESAWGESKLALAGHNLFGVKAGKLWTGETLTLPTREYLNGQWVTVNAAWRKYPDWLSSINDHASFLTRQPRYRKALAGQRSSADFAHQIQLAGYATDPQYAAKLCQIIRKHKLDQYDI